MKPSDDSHLVSSRDGRNIIFNSGLNSRLLFYAISFLNVYEVTWECEKVLLKMATQVRLSGAVLIPIDYFQIVDLFLGWLLENTFLMGLKSTSWAKGILWPMKQDIYQIFGSHEWFLIFNGQMLLKCDFCIMCWKVY